MSKKINWWLKLAIITTLMIVFAFSFSLLFNQKNQQVKSSITFVETTNNSLEDCTFSVNWQNEETTKEDNRISHMSNIQSLSTTNSTAGNTEGYWFTLSENFPSTLLGGTVITIEKGTSTIVFSLDDVVIGQATLNVNALAYRFDGFQLGYKSGDDFTQTKVYSVLDIESFECTVEDLDPNYMGKITFQAMVTATPNDLIAYDLYNTEANYNGFVYGQYFINDDLEISATHPNGLNAPTGKTWAGLLLNMEYFKNNYIDATPGDTMEVPGGGTPLPINKGTYKILTNTIIITKPNTCNLTFTYSGTNAYDPNLYYITSVKGWGQVYQPDGNPVITVKWGNTYTITIDNSNDCLWNSLDNGNDKLYGAVSSGDSDSDFRKTTFDIAADKDESNHYLYGYKFQSSSLGTSFFHNNDYTNNYVAKSNSGGWYYVYSYGQYITGWKIKYELEEIETKYFIYDGSKWSDDGNVSSYTEIDKLTSQNIQTMANFAETLDEFSAVRVGTPEVTLYPQWAPATVKIKVNNADRGEVKFGADYNITYTQEGQSLIYCKTSGANIIAPSGRWNYRNINKQYFEDFEYDTNSHTYTINLTPNFVDDIFKVNLINDDINRAFGDLNADCGYTKVSGSSDITRLTYSTYTEDGYSFTSYNATTYPLIDNYIPELEDYKTVYEEGIDGDETSDFSIFNKVYEDGTALYIYLVNNRVANLPTFTKNAYDLIFWENLKTSNTQHFAYTTHLYEDAIHSAELNGFVGNEDGEGKNYRVWKLSDGKDIREFETEDNKKYVIELKAHYFRINYDIEINTLLDGELSRRGYAVLTIEDKAEAGTSPDNKSGKYLFIYDNADTKMKAYKITTHSSLTSTTLSVGYIQDVVKLYAGCDVTLTIYDQSKDPDAMASKNYDDMIGFKFLNIDQNKPIFESSNLYSVTATSASIEEKNYTSGTQIVINVNFSKIEYQVSVAIKDSKNANSGKFDVQLNATYNYDKVTHQINKIVVGDKCTINYKSYAGYELCPNAYKLGEHTLRTYETGKLHQDYTLTENPNGNRLLDGTWLRLHFYEQNGNNYEIENNNLGQITINTDTFNFDFGIKFYDPTNSEAFENGYIVETLENARFKLDSNFDFVPILTNILNNDYGFFTYRSTRDVEYALLNARLYFPNNHTTTKDVYYTNFDFLLGAVPNYNPTLTSNSLKFMVKNYEEGKIIPSGERKIYYMIEVRELVEIEMKVEPLEKDSNITARTTTLTNGSNNIVPLTINSTPTVRQVPNSVTAYSYKGLENILTSNYDSNFYTGVEYYLNSVKLSSTTFTASESSELVIKYIPKLLSAKITYNYQDGSNASMIDDNNVNKPTAHASYWLNESIAYSVTCVNDDYNVRVTINGDLKGTTDSAVRTIDATHEVVDNDYVCGEIEIVVDVFMKNASKITIKYQLVDASKKVSDDDYGTFSAYEYETIKANNVTNTEFLVIENRDVFVELDLNTGYTYKGIKHNAYDSTEIEIVDGKIKIVSGFDPNVHDGDYLILIDKQSVSAVLNTTGLLGQYTINGAKMLDNLYVGSTINFDHVDVDRERLDYFYYKAGSNVRVEDETLKITSALLEEVDSNIINFGVEVVPRYKLNLNIVNRHYLLQDDWSIINSATGNDYIIGTYCDKDTEIIINAQTLVAGKYNINIKDNVTLVENNVDEISNLKIQLTEDKSYTITITKKTYNVAVAENVYTNLGAIANGSPDLSVDSANQVNGITTANIIYGENATLTLNRVVEDRELAEVYITGNDSDKTIKIVFNGTNFVAYKKDVADANFVEASLTDLGFILSVSESKITLGYAVSNNISLRLDYKMYKIINGV